MNYASFNKFTYLVLDSASQAVKIGVSNSPDIRLSARQNGNPNPLRVVGVVRKDVENQLHRRFQNYRLLGEWFSWPAVQDAIVNGNQIEIRTNPITSATTFITVEWRDYVIASAISWQRITPQSQFSVTSSSAIT